MTTKDIEKPRRGKKAAHANVAASIKELEKHSLVLEEKQKQEAQVHMVMDDAAPVMDGESPTKRSRRTNSQTSPLTGAHSEPRQEQ